MKLISCKFKKNISILLAITFILSNFSSNNVFASTEGLFNLTFTEDTENDGRKNIALDWEDKILFTGSTNKYIVARQKIERDKTTGEITGKWEYRGKYSNNINVLNIYPDIAGSDGLSDWMDNLSATYDNIQIDTDKVGITEFNTNYDNYLIRDNDGNYNYDVIVFGFWDSNDKKDLTAESANEVQKFIDVGGSVLLGHDTVQYSTTNPNFKKLATDNMDLKIIGRDRNIWTYSTEVAVKKQGSVTTFPFDINNESLKIPLSHTLSQLPLDEDDVYMTFQKNLYENGEGPFFQYNLWGSSNLSNKESTTNSDYGGTYRIDSYLTMGNNVALIQSGHASGRTTVGEQKILANVIYSLANIHYDTTAVDQILDEEIPELPGFNVERNEIKFDSIDYGNEYRYRIIALPLEDSVPTLDDNLIYALENSNSYNNGRVAFSNFQYVNVGGELKEFQYIINKNEHMDSLKDTDVLKLQTSNISEVYNYSDSNTNRINIKDDDYMHVVAVDKALNVSNILTINLWEKTPDVTPILRTKGLKDDNIIENGAIKEDVNYAPQKYGTVFAPNIESIDGYIYYKSAATNDVNNITDLSLFESESSIVLTDTNNVITHIYQEPVTRKFYLVEHKTLEIPEKVNVHYYAERVGVLYSQEAVQIPSFVNYNFRGYYTEQEDGELTTPTPGNDKITVDGDQAEVILDPKNEGGLFAHYDKKIGGSIVEFYREDNNVKTVLGSYEQKGYAGEIINSVGSDIEGQMVKDIEGLDNYINKFEVIRDRSANLTQGHEGSEVHHSIELIPREKEVAHYYVDFTQNPTNVERFDTDHVRYDGTTQNVQLRYDGSGEWTAFENYEGPTTSSSAITFKGQEIDFTDPSDTVIVGYYRGTKPSEGYDYTIKYVNSIDDEILEEVDKEVNVPTGMKVNLPIERAIRNANYNYKDGRSVEFVPTGIRITNVTDGQIIDDYQIDYTAEIIDYPTNFPEAGFTGDYLIEILYTPIDEVVITAKVIYESEDSSVVIEGTTTTYTEKVPYGYQYKIPISEIYDLNTHKIKTVKIDGEPDKEWPDPNSELIVKVEDKTDFTKEVELIYIEKTYDLTINTFDQYSGLQFENIGILKTPVYETVDFIIPKIPNYDIDFDLITDEDDKMKFEIVKDDENELIINIIDKSNEEIGTITKDKIAKRKFLKFYPNVEGDFKINLYYKPISVFQKDIYHMDGTLIEALPEEKYYLGEEIQVTIRTINNDQYNIDENTYEIAYGYLDNQKYENLNIGENHILVAHNVAHNVDLYYKPKSDLYELNILINDSDAGIVNKGINYGVEGAEHILSAIPNEGYNFIEWKLIIGALPKTEIENAYASDTDITLDAENVTVKAIFKKEDTDTDIDGNGNGNGNQDNGDKINISTGGGKEQTVVNDLQEKAHYAPYIVGYNDNTVRPQQASERIEFIRMIYNLFAEPNVDVNRNSLANYPDVEDNVWYSEALAFCINIGIVTGFEDGTMRPNAEISRAEMAVMLVKLMDYLELEYENTYREDLEDVKGHWAEHYIHILYNSEIAYGMPNGNFYPNNKVTRAEVVAFINRVLNRNVTQFENNKTFIDLPKDHWAYDDMMSAANGINPKQYEIDHINKKD